MKLATQHGLKAIATFRAFRGLVIAAAVVALSSHTEQTLAAKAEQLLATLDIQIPIAALSSRALGQLDPGVIGNLVFVCLAWSLLLLAQAYGLWRGRDWAVWLAMATSIFVLCGLAWVAAPVIGLKATLLIAGNLLAAAYLLYLLHRRRAGSQ